MQDLPKDPSARRVLVAMSGGIDSTVTARLLKEKGFQVYGITLQLFSRSCPKGSNPAEGTPHDFIERAQFLSRLLDIPHEIINRETLFQAKIMEPFCQEYASGKTPNPCVWCNATVKWPSLYDVAKEKNCPYLATGHYVRLNHTDGRFQLFRGKDPSKDQSYVLYRLSQPVLAQTLFPLGERTKESVRQLGKEIWPDLLNLQESQDICFIPDGDYREFIASRLSQSPGPIEDMAGNLIGTHKGLAFYTVGQRKGLGIATGKPIYIIEKDVASNRLIMGPREALCKRSVIVNEVNWVSISPPAPGTTLKAEVELRYQTQPLLAEIEVLSLDSVRLTLPRHNQSLAPGQSAVWYQGEMLLGGGIMDSAS